MKVLKKLLLAIILVVLAMGLGGAIYVVQTKYFANSDIAASETPEATETTTEAPTEEPDLSQYVITIDTVNIRQEPTTDSAIIEQVGKDTVLQLLYSDAEWSSVIYDGQNAYVNNEFVTAHSLSSDNTQNAKVIAIDAACQSVENSEEEPVGPDSTIMNKKADTGYKGSKTGKNEYELNLEIAVKLKAALESNGYQVVMTRESNDVNISNSKRAEIANSSNADVCISISANASIDEDDKGIIAVCPTINNPYNPGIYNNSYRLANAVSNEVVIATGAVNGGLWQSDTFSIINWSDVPVSVIQLGYLSNSEEEQNLISEEYQDKIVDGIVRGLKVYFGQ